MIEKLIKILELLKLMPLSGFGEIILKIENNKIVRVVKNEIIKVTE